MKEKYIKPQMKVYKIASANLLTGSSYSLTGAQEEEDVIFE